MITIIQEIISWMAAHEPAIKRKIFSCLESELLQAVQLLLCKGDQSRQNISVLRQGPLKALCSEGKNFVCAMLMSLTYPDNVELMIGFMETTDFCKRTQERILDQGLPLPHRLKRQYDLITMYDVYSAVFCSPTKNQIYTADSFETMSSDMQLFIVYLRFRGPVCCIALSRQFK